MGAAASLSTEDEVSQLEANTHFTAREIPKLLKRFARYDPEGRNGGMTLKQFLSIPEISTNPVMPKVASYYIETTTSKLTSTAFITMLSRLSPRNSLADKKQFAFQVLDRDSDGYMSYHELFSLFRMVTGSTLTDDQVLAVITSILSRSDLQQASRLTFEEFTKDYSSLFKQLRKHCVLVRWHYCQHSGRERVFWFARICFCTSPSRMGCGKQIVSDEEIEELFTVELQLP